MGEGHPERPARLNAVEQALQKEGIGNKLDRREPEKAKLSSVELMHPPKYVEKILNSVPSSGITRLDADTQPKCKRLLGSRVFFWSLDWDAGSDA